MSQDKLMDALGFTADDLDANRHGYLTKEQRQRLNRYRRNWANRIIALVLYLAVLLSAVVFFLILFHSLANYANYAIMGASICGIVPLAVSIGIFIKWRQINTDLYKGDVIATTGKLVSTVIYSGRKWKTGYVLLTPSAMFDLPQDTLTAFERGEFYHVYYLLRSEIVLSAERLEKLKREDLENTPV